MEDAADAMVANRGSVLLTVIAYPGLNDLIYANLHRFQMIENFLMLTHEMVLASNHAGSPEVVSLHPAPAKVLPAHVAKRFVDSNSTAAIDCSRNLSDGCITTAVSAAAHGLHVIQSFGRIVMGFAIHAPLSSVPSARCDTAMALAG